MINEEIIKDINGFLTVYDDVKLKRRINNLIKKITTENDIDATDEYGQSLLYIMAQHGRTNIVKKLLYVGANINIQTKNGYTPLITAVSHNFSILAEMLLEMGADANIKNSYDSKALDVAYKGNPGLIELLKKHTFNKEEFNKLLIQRFNQTNSRIK